MSPQWVGFPCLILFLNVLHISYRQYVGKDRLSLLNSVAEFLPPWRKRRGIPAPTTFEKRSKAEMKPRKRLSTSEEAQEEPALPLCCVRPPGLSLRSYKNASFIRSLWKSLGCVSDEVLWTLPWIRLCLFLQKWVWRDWDCHKWGGKGPQAVKVQELNSFPTQRSRAKIKVTTQSVGTQ